MRDEHDTASGAERLVKDDADTLYRENHRVSRALREAEIRYQELFDHIPLGLYRSMPDGTLLDVNPALVEMFGYPDRAALMAMNTADLYVDPRDRDHMLDVIARRGSARDLEYEVRRYDGSTMWVKENVHAVRDERGEVLYYEGSLEDITVQRRTVEALQRSWLLYRATIDSLDEAIHVIDRDYCFVLTNRTMAQWCAKYHLEPDLARQTLFEAFPFLPQRVREEYRHVFESGERLVTDEVNCFDGQEVLTETLKIPILQADKVVQVLTIVRDVTARKKVEEALRGSELKFRTLAERSPNMIFINCGGHIVYANQQCAETMGYSLDELYAPDFDFLALIAPDHREMLLDNFRRHMRGEEIEPYEYALVTNDGRRVEVVITTKLIDYEGQSAILGIITDVTQLRRLEERLHTAEKMEAIGQLAGGIAHEFNNLLTIINGYCEYILDDLGEEHPSYGDVEAIAQAGQRAANLTRQLLAFSRRQVRDTRVLDLNGVLGSMGNLLRRILGEDVALQMALDDELLCVEGDEGQITQVILNLVSNARDAMPRGGVLILETRRVTLEADFAASHLRGLPGEHALLAVRDTGIGMSTEVMQHLFEPFFTTKGQGKGTGLGLASVYGIVQQSKGHIDVVSAPGEGTAFGIYLPCVPGPPEPRPKRDGELPAATPGRATILIVEDEADVRSFATRVLQRQGYTTLTAASGEQALMLCEAHGGAIDLVLTDVVMPTMHGPELVQELRGYCGDFRVLYMSGYPEDTLARYGIMDLGASFLQKPFTHEALLVARVQQLLGMPRGMRR